MRIAPFALLALLVLAGCNPPYAEKESTPNPDVVASKTPEEESEAAPAHEEDVPAAEAAATEKKTEGKSLEINAGDDVSFKASEKGVSAKFKDGAFEIGSANVTEKELGLPFYPKSTQPKDQGLRVTADGQKVVSSVRWTTDTPEQVIQFYKAEMVSPNRTKEGQMLVVEGKLGANGEVKVEAKDEDGKTKIQVTVKRGARQPN